MTRMKALTPVDTVFETITQALKSGDKVELRGFGSVTTRIRNPRISRNPKTGKIVHIPAKRVPFFKAGKDLKIIRDQLILNPPSKKTKNLVGIEITR